MTSDRAVDGAAPVELVLGVGLLLLPVAVLVLSLPTWVERISAARVAAQEAARTVVLADDAGSGLAAADALVTSTGANHGLPTGAVRLCVSSHAAAAGPAPCGSGPVLLLRGGAVTAEVTVDLPLLQLPGLPTALGEVAHTVRHTELVDAFRSFP